jgi:hypothetical protein
MKKISTLAFGFLFSVASFANYAPNRLTVVAEGNDNIKVTVDGSRFDQQPFNNSVVFENLQPGFHAVRIYRLEEKRRGFFGRSSGAAFRLVYTASVNIKPLFATTIELNRFGRAQVIEVPLRGAFDNRGWDRKDGRGYHRGYDKDGRDNRDYRDNDRDRNNSGYGNNGYGDNNGYGNSSYSRSISDEDFFAAERVMERENFDNARLLYAKRVADENWLSAEQVKSLARFFSFDNSRMEFVKYAYSKTTDKGNFSVVCNAFDSNHSKDQLMSFIKYGR